MAPAPYETKLSREDLVKRILTDDADRRGKKPGEVGKIEALVSAYMRELVRAGKPQKDNASDDSKAQLGAVIDTDMSWPAGAREKLEVAMVEALQKTKQFQNELRAAEKKPTPELDARLRQAVTDAKESDRPEEGVIHVGEAASFEERRKREIAKMVLERYTGENGAITRAIAMKEKAAAMTLDEKPLPPVYGNDDGKPVYKDNKGHTPSPGPVTDVALENSSALIPPKTPHGLAGTAKGNSGQTH